MVLGTEETYNPTKRRRQTKTETGNDSKRSAEPGGQGGRGVSGLADRNAAFVRNCQMSRATPEPTGGDPNKVTPMAERKETRKVQRGASRVYNGQQI